MASGEASATRQAKHRFARFCGSLGVAATTPYHGAVNTPVIFRLVASLGGTGGTGDWKKPTERVRLKSNAEPKEIFYAIVKTRNHRRAR
jgi:hypothetical protein